jgi:hypothetical protein
MDLKVTSTGDIIGRSAAPHDVQACPACGHFFSPAINAVCTVCSARKDLESARADLLAQRNRAELFYQKSEAALSDLRVAQNTIGELNTRVAELRSARESAREAHLEHLETIIVRIATGK